MGKNQEKQVSLRMFPKSILRQFSVSWWIKWFMANLNKFLKSIKVFTKEKYVCFMVRLWKIMFDLVLTMSVGVLLRLGGAVKKNRLRKKNKKSTFWKFKSLSELTKKSYCRHATFVSSDKLLSFLKGHFLFFFTKDFAISSLFLFCVFFCLSHFVQTFYPHFRKSNV